MSLGLVVDRQGEQYGERARSNPRVLTENIKCNLEDHSVLCRQNNYLIEFGDYNIERGVNSQPCMMISTLSTLLITVCVCTGVFHFCFRAAFPNVSFKGRVH